MNYLVYVGHTDVNSFVRDVAAFIIAYLKTGANVMFSGEIPFNDKRLDHIGYRASQMFLSLMRLDEIPLIVIEDSSDEKRLRSRMAELRQLSIDKAYIHVNYVDDEDLIMSLRRSPAEVTEDMYILEVGGRCWTLQR